MEIVDRVDGAVGWVIDRHFDLIMTLVVETRSWLESCESLVGDVEDWLYRQHSMIR